MKCFPCNTWILCVVALCRVIRSIFRLFLFSQDSLIEIFQIIWLNGYEICTELWVWIWNFIKITSLYEISRYNLQFEMNPFSKWHEYDKLWSNHRFNSKIYKRKKRKWLLFYCKEKYMKWYLKRIYFIFMENFHLKYLKPLESIELLKRSKMMLNHSDHARPIAWICNDPLS